MCRGDRRSICFRARSFRHRVSPHESPGPRRKESDRSRNGKIVTKQGPANARAAQPTVASDPRGFNAGSISNQRRHAPWQVTPARARYPAATSPLCPPPTITTLVSSDIASSSCLRYDIVCRLRYMTRGCQRCGLLPETVLRSRLENLTSSEFLNTSVVVVTRVFVK